jgi:hypothetical protein
MASESPWVVLAERLGYRIAEGIYVRSRLRYAMPIDHEETHSMLVGETLRVARRDQIKRPFRTAESMELVRFCVYQIGMAEGDARAAACLELLDVVGYDHAH